MTETIGVVPIAAYIRKNLPSMFSSVGYGNRKKREDFTNWISWNMGRLNVCVIPKGNKIGAVGIAKSISDPLDSRYPYKFNERGDILYVHLAIADNHEAFRALLCYCKFRWPLCKKIMFYRKKNKKMTTYNFKRFLELVESKPLERIG
jgi:hypothetical protein